MNGFAKNDKGKKHDEKKDMIPFWGDFDAVKVLEALEALQVRRACSREQADLLRAVIAQVVRSTNRSSKGANPIQDPESFETVILAKLLANRIDNALDKELPLTHRTGAFGQWLKTTTYHAMLSSIKREERRVKLKFAGFPGAMKAHADGAEDPGQGFMQADTETPDGLELLLTKELDEAYAQAVAFAETTCRGDAILENFRQALTEAEDLRVTGQSMSEVILRYEKEDAGEERLMQVRDARYKAHSRALERVQKAVDHFQSLPDGKAWPRELADGVRVRVNSFKRRPNPKTTASSSSVTNPGSGGRTES